MRFHPDIFYFFSSKKSFVAQKRTKRLFCPRCYLIEEATLSFNDVLVTKLTSVQLDFWTGFTVSASKRSGYDVMTGHVASLNEPYIAYNGFAYGDGFDDSGAPVYNKSGYAAIAVGAGLKKVYGRNLPATVVNLPLPFFFNYTTSKNAVDGGTRHFFPIKSHAKSSIHFAHAADWFLKRGRQKIIKSLN